jgi:hypothetical protein
MGAEAQLIQLTEDHSRQVIARAVAESAEARKGPEGAGDQQHRAHELPDGRARGVGLEEDGHADREGD